MKWQNPIKEGHQKNVEALTRINKLLEVTKLTPEQRTEAMLLIDKAGEIIKQVQDDGSWGVHAFNYTKQRVETAQAYLTKAQSIIDQDPRFAGTARFYRKDQRTGAGFAEK